MEVARVAEILVAGPPGTGGTPGRGGRRGSGYRVADRHVLTAAHVLTPLEASVSVRFDADRPGEWSSEARIVLRSVPADLALLELLTPCGAVGPSPRYAAVPDADLVLPFTAVGFPRFKIRQDADALNTPLGRDGRATRYRDTFHASGTVAALSNRREGTLELTVPPPPDTTDGSDGASPWQGMSGAAVWSGGALIGVIAAHHRADGLARLAATRVESWYEKLSGTELAILRRCAGLPPREHLATGPVPDRPCSLASLPSTLTLRELNGLIGELAALPTLGRAHGVELVLQGVDPRVSANRQRDPVLRIELYHVLRTCLRYPGALDQLFDMLRLLEDGSPEMRHVDDALAQLLARHRSGNRAP